MALLESKVHGSHLASKVRVESPQGSWYDGRKGTVVRVQGDTVFVRFGTNSPALPFGRGELREV